jgi:uncharacterized RDD family membrane protein YckC/cytoskeletal protein CcmA (bactofilin family)
MSLLLAAALGLLLVNQSPLMSQTADAGAPKRKGVHREAVVSIGQDAELKEGDSADQVVVIGGSAKIAGAVDQDVVIIGGDAEIDGDIANDVVIVMGTVHLGPKAVIHRDFVVVGGKAEVAEGATVEGRTQVVGVGLPLEPLLRLGWLKSWLANCVLQFRPLSLQVGWVWWFAGAFFVLYLLIAVLFPHPVECCWNQITTRPATTFAVGIMAKLLMPVILILLTFTIIGIFIVPFIVVGAFLSLLVGKVALLEYLGSKIGGPFGLKGGQRLLAALCVGVAFITLLYLVPVLGLITAIVLSLWGFGAAVTAGWIALRRETRAVTPGSAPLAAPPVAADATAGAPPINPPPAVLYPRAGFWERMGAGFLDIALISVTSALIGPVSVLVAIAYFSGMWAWKGTTVGGIVLNLQVVREDGNPLNFLAAFVRSLAAVFSILALFLGFFWIGWDGQKQGWHDKIAGTVVVRLPKAISLVCL